MVQPFGEVLFGAAHTNAYATIADVETGTVTSGSGNNNGFAMAAGGGIDIKINKNFSVRPVEVDYLLTRFSANHIAGYTANQNNFRYVGGFLITLGGAPPVPPTASCSVNPTSILAGDPVSATVMTQNFNPKHTITYSWSSSGGQVTGSTESAGIATAGRGPGSYTVSVTATDEKERKNNSANCTASFTVRPFPPPTASCCRQPKRSKVRRSLNAYRFSAKPGQQSVDLRLFSERGQHQRHGKYSDPRPQRAPPPAAPSPRRPR